MKLKMSITFLLGYLLSITLYAQNHQWTGLLQGSQDAVFEQVITDFNGDIIALGRKKGSPWFSTQSSEVQLKYLRYDAGFLMKLSPQGEVKWVAHFASRSLSEALAIGTDAFGDIYLAGSFDKQLYRHGDSKTDTLFSDGPSDAFLMKYDSGGEPRWMKRFGGKDEDWFSAMDVNPAGEVALGYEVAAESNPDAQIGELSLPINLRRTVKLDSEGALIWKVDIPGGHTTALAIDQRGNVYRSGYFGYIADFDPSNEDDKLSVGLFASSGFLQKIDASGKHQWVKEITKSFAASTQVDSDGCLFLSGKLQNNFQVGGESFTQSASNLGRIVPGSAAMVAKLDADGRPLWVRYTTGLGNESLSAMAVDERGDVIFSGTFSGTIDADPGSGLSRLTAPHGGHFIIKLNGDGGYQWAHKLMEGDTIRAHSLSAYGDELVLAGSFTNTLRLHTDSDSIAYESDGKKDDFLIKLASGAKDPMDREHDSAFLVYPNPTSRYLHIEFPVLIEGFGGGLYNTAGQEMDTFSSEGYGVRLDISTYRPGIYFVKINTSSGKTIIKKIVKR
jgi:hypothetical protein